MHGESQGKIAIQPVRCCCIYTQKETQVKLLEQYQNKLKKCKQCDKLISPKNIFCGSSCAASFNNIQRQKDGFVVTEEHKQKTSKSVISTVTEKYKRLGKEFKPKIIRKPRVDRVKTVKVRKTNRKAPIPKHKSTKNFHPGAPYSKIYYRTCNKCGLNFISTSTIKYCVTCAEEFGAEYRSRYKFQFNVYHYPDIFDIPYIESIGWYSRGGHAGEWNPDGLSRDHKISVNDAIQNGYDPYYIKHPLNCEIMTWVENNKKKTKSSMSYDELVKMVDDYDAIHGKMYTNIKKV